MSDWGLYDLWNQAIAQVVFSNERAGTPVFLDFEQPVIDALANSVGSPPEGVGGELASAVRSTLNLGSGPATVLREHTRRLDAWWVGNSLEPPPSLALLAIMSLAAEQMREEDGLAANNFYGRLGAVLSLSDADRDEFIAAYRREVNGAPTSAWLWGSLNAWLERHDGNLGLPTAHAGRLAHVDYAISQAIVREGDRRRLPDFFTWFGLPPQGDLDPSEMEALLSEWNLREPPPFSASLRRLWADPDSRERVVDIACAELSAWDGSGTSAELTLPGRARIVQGIRVRAVLARVPVPKFEISLVVAKGSNAGTGRAEFVDEAGNAFADIDLFQAAPGWLALGDASTVDSETFLMSETRIRFPETGALTERRPRLLVPLRHDGFLSAYVEAERVRLGEDTMLLCTERLAPLVGEILSAVARPGWSDRTELSGLPSGWHLFQNVQVLSSIPDDLLKGRRVELNILQPLSRTQVALEGGLSLPGNIQKFSSLVPPELRVTCDGAATIDVDVYRDDERSNRRSVVEEGHVHVDEAVLIAPMAPLELEDGDYQIHVTVDGHPLGVPKRLRLRSADSPAVTRDENSLPLGRHGSAEAVLGADETPGAWQTAPRECAPAEWPRAETKTPGWWTARQKLATPELPSDSITFPAPSSGSCVVTGAHYMVIETAMPGMTTMEGVCSRCGLVKRYPVRGRRVRQRHGGSETGRAARISVQTLPPVAEGPEVNWDVGFDSLCHVGRGPWLHFQQIASQIDPSPVFADAFVRTLESLGHVEIRRDLNTLAPIEFQVAQPALARIADGRFVLCGRRGRRLVEAIEKAANQAGTSLTMTHLDGAPTRMRLETTDFALATTVASLASQANRFAVTVIDDAYFAVAAELPPLSAVLSVLPTTTAITGRKTERWDEQTAKFVPCRDATAPGAYRVSSFVRTYVLRRTSDIGSLEALLGDARLVKHAAALEAGAPLAGYDSDAEVLYTPLGADLPGLYARSACLATGKPPRPNQEDHLLEYHGVSPSHAGRLLSLLSS